MKCLDNATMARLGKAPKLLENGRARRYQGDPRNNFVDRDWLTPRVL